ncbi:bifunctional protein-serine/threonine kinase/phosphatase, partial [Vibrio parahaemolyticus]
DVEAGDVFVFTTDGVHDFIRIGQIANILKVQADNLDEAASTIVAAALKNGSADNLTCQIVRVDNPGRPDQQAIFSRLTA